MPLSRAVCDAQSRLAVRAEELSLLRGKAEAHATQLRTTKEDLEKVSIYPD